VSNANEPASHRQTGYTSALQMDSPEVLPVPGVCSTFEQAKSDLAEYGLCLFYGAMTNTHLEELRNALVAQAEAERKLGELAPLGAFDPHQLMWNMVNKGSIFTDLIESNSVEELGSFLLGKDFLISSITAGVFHLPTTEPQLLHRDQGQVPATVDFPAAANVFWLLDDFTPERGSTWVIPGSHRWPSEHLVKAPSRKLATQVSAPAGTLFVFDGRIWHGAGANTVGHPRRHIANFLCLPWMRQQENWGVTCRQAVLDNASSLLRRRLGMCTYGALGMMNGTQTESSSGRTPGKHDIEIPKYIIGEGGELFPVQRVP